MYVSSLMLFTSSCSSEFPSGFLSVHSEKWMLAFLEVLVCWRWNSPRFSAWKWLYFIFTLEVYLKYIFTGYGIWQCFSFSILKRFYFLLASIGSTEKSPVLGMLAVNLCLLFPSGCFADFPLTVAFQQSGSIYLGVVFSVFSLCGMCWVSWFCELIFFISLYKS